MDAAIEASRKSEQDDLERAMQQSAGGGSSHMEQRLQAYARKEVVMGDSSEEEGSEMDSADEAEEYAKYMASLKGGGGAPKAKAKAPAAAKAAPAAQASESEEEEEESEEDESGSEYTDEEEETNTPAQSKRAKSKWKKAVGTVKTVNNMKMWV